jgi:hypothetical protein
MENTLQNKSKFFAQYLFQEVLLGYSCDVNFCKPIELQEFHLSTSYLRNKSNKKALNPNPVLSLKPIEKISNEDAEICFHQMFSKSPDKRTFVRLDIRNDEQIKILFHYKYSDSEIDEGGCQLFYSKSIGYQCGLDVCDFLRSKGYALPFMDLSVNDLVSHGWVVLK